MYKDNKILCIIPARGGSKALPGKNIKELAGKPLIGYTIEQALGSRYIDRIVVSTEDNEIADVSISFGAEVPFMRPCELADDSAGTIDVLLHAVKWLEDNGGYQFDILTLLHVTTPLRDVEDIDRCIELLVKNRADNVFSVTESHKNPYFNMVEQTGNRVRLVKEGCFLTRQAAPKVYDINCSIYVWWKDILKEKRGLLLDKTHLYEMPKERSVDIDDLFDFYVAETFLKKGEKNIYS